MGRKRKYNKGESIWEKYDWSINPELTREIIAIVLSALGFFLLISEFNAGGSIGNTFFGILEIGFGGVSYLIPFVLAFLAIILWLPSKFEIKPLTTIGVTLLFFTVPALFNTLGGKVGEGIHGVFSNLFGPFGAFIILFGITLALIVMSFNLSLKNLFGGMKKEGENSGVKIHGEEEQKVSVFTTLANLKNKITVNQPVQRPQAPNQQSIPVKNISDAGWEFPSTELLDISTSKATSGNISKNVEIIQKTLNDFNIDVAMGEVNIGPTVTQYCMKPKEGIKLNQIVARSDDLSLSLAAHPLRIEAPIPGKSAVGLEIPNKVAAIVTMREIIESDVYKNKKSNLSLCLGRGVAGEPVISDLKKMPHLLIAGSTGSGKSICINSIISGFLYQNSPADLRMILVDPKRVEFTPYNGIAHLMCPVVTEPDKTINALKWAVGEMERRYRVLQENGNRDIDSYNSKPPEGVKMPYIVIVIDELADLMAQSANEVEGAIVRLAQMARAVGIHLIVATQRPSVDVITGIIKANIATRIAFAVASQIDSRTIIDQSGAEKLLGRGDMLYLSHDFGKPKRIQGVLITDKEVKKVTEFLKRNGSAGYDESIVNYKTVKPGMSGSDGEIDDEMYEEAKQTVIQAGKASASLLQRRLRVGYARAARLLDLLEEQGVIGPAEGAKPRDILVGFDDSPPSNQSYNQTYTFTPAFKPVEPPVEEQISESNEIK